MRYIFGFGGIKGKSGDLRDFPQHLLYTPKNFFQGPSTSSGRGRQQQAAVHYPNPKETKVTMYKRLKRFGSWIRKTASEKDCALIVLVFLFIF